MCFLQKSGFTQNSHNLHQVGKRKKGNQVKDKKVTPSELGRGQQLLLYATSHTHGFLNRKEGWGKDFPLASGWISKPYEGSVSKKEKGKHGFWVSC